MIDIKTSFCSALGRRDAKTNGIRGVSRSTDPATRRIAMESVDVYPSLPWIPKTVGRIYHICRGTSEPMGGLLHWVRDVTFDEDRSQIRKGFGPRVMATLRNLVISLFRIHEIKNIAQALRKYYFDKEYVLQFVGL